MSKLSKSHKLHVRHLRDKLHGSLVMFVVAFAVLGTALLAISRAATNNVVLSAEAESGTLANGASTVADSSASGGSAVKFGSGSSTYACNLSYTNNLPEDWTSSSANNPGATCPYSDVSYITTGDPNNGPYLNQNVWGAPPPNFVQSLHANSPRDWYVNINEASDNPSDPNANGGVHNYPNLGFWMRGKVDDYSTITSSWNVTIPQTNSVAGWAAYDLWFNDDNTEVMIQADIGADSYYNCTSVATATFGGQPWHMCDFGTERVWKRGTVDNHLVAAASGTVDIKQILTWMEGHTFVDPSNGTTRQQLAPGSSWQTAYVGASFGFEIPSTSGQTQTFRVNDFSWTAAK
jgi:hypothetical protein